MQRGLCPSLSRAKKEGTGYDAAIRIVHVGECMGMLVCDEDIVWRCAGSVSVFEFLFLIQSLRVDYLLSFPLRFALLCSLFPGFSSLSTNPTYPWFEDEDKDGGGGGWFEDMV